MFNEKYVARFFAKVDKAPGHGPAGDCWVWTAKRMKGGYGTVGDGAGKTALAHRVAWTISAGAPPGALCVCHRCDNPSCVRPEHLFLGTHRENMNDRDRKGRQGCRTRPDRVARGSRVGVSKLSDPEIPVIRALYALGLKTQAQLGKDFGVTQTMIGRIVRRQAWIHI